MAEVRLHNTYQGEADGEKKSAEGASIAAQNLTTSYAQFGSDYYDVGCNTVFKADVAVTYASGTLISVRAKYLSLDGTNWIWVPSYAAPSSGVSASSIATITAVPATFDRDGTIADFEAAFNAPEARKYQLWIKSDSATGSATATVGVGKGT